jgi:hypothetical protein
MRHLMALLLLFCTSAPLQTIAIVPTPSGMPCAEWRDLREYQRRIAQKAHCAKMGKRWAMKEAKP